MTRAEVMALYHRVAEIGEMMVLDEEAFALHEAARRATVGIPLVEIGSFKGTSASMLLSGMAGQSFLVCVDPHTGVSDTTNAPEQIDPAFTTIADFWRAIRMTGRQRGCVIVPARSDEAFSVVQRLVGASGAGLVFVDGSHMENDAYKDFDSYSRLIVPGGFLVVDDLGYETVRRAWDRWDHRVHHFAPVDLRVWGIVDEVHRRLHEGCVAKMAFFQRTR